MTSRTIFVLSIVLVFAAACGPRAGNSVAVANQVGRSADDGGVRPHGGMLRYPDVSATHVVFVYANDLWLVPRDGGVATPLASPPGPEEFPRFSPDGSTIGFVGNYEGDRDLYTIPTAGGVAARLTHHPSTETLTDWTPGGELLFFSSGMEGLGRQTHLFTVPPGGGLPAKLPVPYGANGAISPDGKWLAYTPHTRDQRTWKRYRGGMATDIWLFNLETHESKKITDWEGTDSLPMWHGRTVFYLSDAGPNHRLNIWAYDTTNDARRQVTNFDTYDSKWPSMGPGPNGKGEIVLQNGASLHLVDLSSGATRALEVVIPGDRPTIRPRDVDATENLESARISATGKRAVFEARGDIYTVPAEKGVTRNLTRTDSVAERDASWSPDGRWIAYFSDATGEYELYVAQSDGKGETKQLTEGGNTYRYEPIWSPDSKRIAYTDKTGALYLHTIESDESVLVDTDPWAQIGQPDFSSDSRWVAYTRTGDNQRSAVWIFDTQSAERRQVTSGRFNDTWPTFDRKGKYLFLASQREISSPTYEDLGTTFIYVNTDVLLVVPLQQDVASPWAPKSDEESWDGKEGDEDDEDDDEDAEGSTASAPASAESGDDPTTAPATSQASTDESEDEEGDDDEEDEKDEKKPPEPVEIDFEGFERRAVRIPVKSGNFFNLSVNDEGKLIYVRGVPRGEDGDGAIKIFDLSDKNEKKEEKTVIDGVNSYSMSADGKKLLVQKDDKFAIIDAAADQKMEKSLSLADMRTTIRPRHEWKQLLREAWRIQRDFFYDPNMHGVDWDGVYERYSKMLDECVSREDVRFVIGEMISELNVGHAYARSGGDMEDEPSVAIGMLGADYELHDGAYRIRTIHEGGVWDDDARGPLSQPGVDVKVGDYLLAVNGVPVDASKDPWAAFEGLAGKVVSITVSEKPVMDEDARDVLVEPMGSEGNLRFRSWIEKNRKYVEEKSEGKVGYIYVPDTGVNGQDNLFRQFYGQTDKAALIIDERWNGGGQIPTRFIELLNRPRTNYWAVRDGRDWAWPPDSHQGPKCMLINGLAGSGGDCFPYFFRQSRLGKLIGMRTWGGLVGISGNPSLIDGGQVTAPTFAFYETDGTWGVEGHGVDPDIEVIDDPALMVDGGDPQLDAAIELMLKEIETNGYRPPQRPAYPDRSGMGIPDADK